MSWNFHLLFRLFIWTYCRVSGSPVTMLRRLQQSWPHVDQVTNEVASDDIFDAHTLLLFEKKYGEILQGSSWRVTSERRLRGFLETQFDLPGWCKGSKSFLSGTRSIPSCTFDGESYL